MKRLMLVIGIFLACLVQAQAQKISGGIKAGMNTTTWSGDAVGAFANALGVSGGTITATGFKPGFHLGGYLDIPVGANFSLEPGLYYSTKGMQAQHTFNQNSLLKMRATITNEAHYLDLPVLAKFTFDNGFQLFAGPQLSYLLHNQVRAEAGLLGMSYDYAVDWNAGLRDFDFALAGGIGYQFTNGLQLNATYDHGLTSLDQGRSNFDIYNRALKFSVGYTFR
jgi:hypothetical protein